MYNGGGRWISQLSVLYIPKELSPAPSDKADFPSPLDKEVFSISLDGAGISFFSFAFGPKDWISLDLPWGPASHWAILFGSQLPRASWAFILSGFLLSFLFFDQHWAFVPLSWKQFLNKHTRFINPISLLSLSCGSELCLSSSCCLNLVSFGSRSSPTYSNLSWW